MAGKTPSEAVRNFVSPLQQALSCLVREILLVSPGGYTVSPFPHALSLSHEPAPLGSDGQLWLKFSHRYHIVKGEGRRGPWKVSTVGYEYTVCEPGEAGREIFAYHWHPDSRSAIAFPHFHLYQGTGTIRADMRKAHFPTGRMALEDLLRLVITQFGVTPHRDDWADILQRTQDAFETWRTRP